MGRGRRLWGRFRQRFMHIGLSFKFLLVILFATVVPLSLSLFVFNSIISDNAVNESVQSMQGTMDIIQTSISEQTTDIRQDVLLILADNNVRELIQERPTGLNTVSLQKLKTLADIVIDTVEKKSYVSSVTIYVDNYPSIIDQRRYQPISYVKDSAWYEKLDSVPEKTMWITKRDMEGDNSVNATSKASSRNHPLSSLAFVTKIVDISDYRRHEAIIRIDYSDVELQKMLQNGLATLPVGAIGLLDSSGIPLLSVSSGGEETAYDSLLTLESTDGDPLEYTEESACQKYWKYQRPISGPDWQVVSVLIPRRSAFPSSETLNPLVISLTVSWIAVFLLALLFSHSITTRIRKLTENIRAMRELQKPIPMPSTRFQDEITELSDNFVHMTRELRGNMRREYLLGISKQSSDLRALQAQINPHFLYNTLELIDYYAFEFQPEMVEKIVTKLAKFYKLSLNHGKESYQLWQEIQLVNSYFDIQNIRYQSKIELHIDIPAEFDQCLIPPITLQPLVENAINHGIRERPDKTGDIFLTARRERDDLILILRDNGVGMSAETVDWLNNGVQLPATSRDSGSHYGVLNIDQRLKIMFGERYGLHFSSVPGQETTATIIIPI